MSNLDKATRAAQWICQHSRDQPYVLDGVCYWADPIRGCDLWNIYSVNEDEMIRRAEAMGWEDEDA